MEQVLICAPTAQVKNYCVKDWLLNINQFSYPNFKVVLFDTTPDKGENTDYLNLIASSLPLKYEFEAIAVPVGNRTLMERICLGHNYCVHYAILENYKRFLHLESDVFPPSDIIEKLLCQKKSVIGALYYRDEGASRRLMVWRHIDRGANNVIGLNLGPKDDAWFVDGTTKQVGHVGLGAVMIDTSIFKQLMFRVKKDVDASADTYFAEDCYRLNIGIFADTSIICEHRNESWGQFKIDY